MADPIGRGRVDAPVATALTGVALSATRGIGITTNAAIAEALGADSCIPEMSRFDILLLKPLVEGVARRLTARRVLQGRATPERRHAHAECVRLAPIR